MYNIGTINQGTVERKGGGLPFYKNKQHVLTVKGRSEAYEGRPCPLEELPSFQFWAMEDTFVSLELESLTTGVVYPITIAPSLSITGVLDDNDQKFIITSTGIKINSPHPPCGLYIIQIVLSLKQDGPTQVYYSAEVSFF